MILSFFQMFTLYVASEKKTTPKVNPVIQLKAFKDYCETKLETYLSERLLSLIW